VPPNPQVFAAVTDAMKKDKDEVVQVRAASALASLTRSAGAPKEIANQSIKDLVAQFRLYGSGCKRTDKEWGWREVGNALRLLGNDGEAALAQVMADKQDQQLAELAWRVLYLKQEDKFCFVTEEQDRAAHEKHPSLKLKVSDSRD
jgi:hypothetical protein